MALSLIQERIASSDLLTAAYAQYLPLLADGIRFYLEGISPARLHRILAEQMHLPSTASTAERVVALLHHAPALHKLGQVVGRDHRLDSVFRKHLRPLESLEPRLSTTEVTCLLEAQFEDWHKAGIKLGPHPLAEGSVAVVMPFTWEAPAAGELPREGVFKLLKPGIESILDEDLKVLGLLGDFLDQDCARYHLPALDYQETFVTIRDLLLHEIRLNEEQEHLKEAGKIYKNTPSVAIPAVLPFCTPALTAMGRIYGHKVGEDAPPEGISRGTLAGAIADSLIAKPIFSSQTAALFHADPHAGNLLVTPEGRIGILDWSLAGRLSKEDRVQLVQLLLEALTLNLGGLEQVIEKLTHRAPNRPALRQVLQDGLQELRWGTRPGISWLTKFLDNLVLRAGVKLNGNLLLFRKSLLMLEGVLADLTQTDTANQSALLDQTLLARFLSHWAAEWPRRLCAPFTTRSFATHISAADVLSLLCSTPLTAARWWSATSLEILGAMQSGKFPTPLRKY